LVFGVLVHAWLLARGQWWGRRYYSLYGASLPFAIGANLYLWRERLPRMPSWALAAVAPLAIANALLADRVGAFGGCMYVNMALATVAVAALSMRPERRLDATLGDASYPVYLLHFAVAAVVEHMTGMHGGVRLLATVVLPLGLVVAICRWCVEMPIERVRRRLRGVPARSVACAGHAELLPTGGGSGAAT